MTSPCCSRRHFLNSLGGGFGALAFSMLLRQEQARAGERPPAVIIDPSNPFLPRAPHIPSKVKSIIVLYQVGGPSQIDTFDYKPELQKLNGKPVPQSFRDALKNSKHANVFEGCKDELYGSPFKWAQYGQNGMWVSDLQPEVGKHVDELCFIRSMQADSNNHAPASYQFHTGDIQAGKASLGSWLTYGLGTENQNLPGYVLLFEAGPLGGAANYSNAFLPPAFQGTRLRDQGTPVLDLLPPKEIADGQRDSIDLINQLNTLHRKNHKDVLELDARIASYELAYRMQSSAVEVGDLEKETPELRRAYGLEHKDPQVVKYGRKCMLARRLVERGVRFVQVYNMFDADGWDSHANLDKNHPKYARQTDQPIAALLTDLKQRGLWDQTLVIWASEFGRTPMMQGDKGRQHNAAGFTVWLAGGGTRPGIIGATDDIGLMAIENPHPFKDLHATIMTAMGIRYEDMYYETSGRPERLTGVAGTAKPISGVLG